MENKKCILVFTLIIAFLLTMVTFVQASNADNPLQIIRNQESGNNTQQNTNNTTNGNNTTSNNIPNIGSTNRTTNNTTGNTANNTTNNLNNTKLPQTGVAEDTTLIVFIAVCIISAIYAFIRIRNYKNV